MEPILTTPGQKARDSKPSASSGSCSSPEVESVRHGGFTPGPWVAFPAKNRWDIGAHKRLFDDGMWMILPEYDLERIPIAMVDHADDHDPPTRKKAEYDAHLIAAAPELLWELKVATCYLYAAFRLESGGPVQDALRQCEAVIAKAEGRRVHEDLAAPLLVGRTEADGSLDSTEAKS